MLKRVVSEIVYLYGVLYGVNCSFTSLCRVLEGGIEGGGVKGWDRCGVLYLYGVVGLFVCVLYCIVCCMVSFVRSLRLIGY